MSGFVVLGGDSVRYNQRIQIYWEAKMQIRAGTHQLAKQSAILLLVLLVGCVTINKDSSAHVRSEKSETSIKLLIPGSSLYFNIHAVGWTNEYREYEIVFPRNRNHVQGEEIALFPNSTHIASSRLPLDPLGSSVTLLGPTDGDCSITVALFDPKGEPYPVNGSYSTSFHSCQR